MVQLISSKMVDKNDFKEITRSFSDEYISGVLGRRYKYPVTLMFKQDSSSNKWIEVDTVDNDPVVKLVYRTPNELIAGLKTFTDTNVDDGSKEYSVLEKRFVLTTYGVHSILTVMTLNVPEDKLFWIVDTYKDTKILPVKTFLSLPSIGKKNWLKHVVQESNLKLISIYGVVEFIDSIVGEEKRDEALALLDKLEKSTYTDDDLTDAFEGLLDLADLDETLEESNE